MGVGEYGRISEEEVIGGVEEGERVRGVEILRRRVR